MISAARVEKSSVSTSASVEASRDIGHTPTDETEAYQVLLAQVGRKTGAIPAPLLVKHVLTVTRDADWPVQREAMEALLRRLSFGRRDELVIASRPPNRAIFGRVLLDERDLHRAPDRSGSYSVTSSVAGASLPPILVISV